MPPPPHTHKRRILFLDAAVGFHGTTNVNFPSRLLEDRELALVSVKTAGTLLTETGSRGASLTPSRSPSLLSPLPSVCYAPLPLLPPPPLTTPLLPMDSSRCHGEPHNMATTPLA